MNYLKGDYKMKKMYQELDMELIRFASDDVITTSPGGAHDDTTEELEWP